MKILFIFLFLTLLVSCSGSDDKEGFLKKVIIEKYPAQQVSSFNVEREVEGNNLTTVHYKVKFKSATGETTIVDSLQYSRTGDGFYQLYKKL